MLDLIRYLALGAFALCASVALASWAVRDRKISPFSPAGKALRQLSDPLIRPVERWVVSRGGSPQSAPWWLFGIALGGAIVVVTLSRWMHSQMVALSVAQASGPRGILRLVVYYAGQLVLIAIIVRVIGSWFGLGRYSRWMRWAYVLSDWIIEPLRKVIPPLGVIDISAIVAWLVIQLVLSLLMSWL